MLDTIRETAGNAIATILYPHLGDTQTPGKFTTEEHQEGAGLLQSENDTEHPPRTTLPLDTRQVNSVRYDFKRELYTQTVNVNGLGIDVLVSHIQQKSVFGTNERHRCLSVGGNDENVTSGAPIRSFPYLAAWLDKGTEKQNFGNRKLDMYQVSFRDLKFDGKPYQPKSAQEWADIVFAFNESIGGADSMILRSMGSNALAGVQNRNPAVVPKHILLDRTCPSTEKLSRVIPYQVSYILFPITYIAAKALYYIACWTGWAADPENDLAQFAAKNDLKNRSIVVIGTENDHYFRPGISAWDNLLERIQRVSNKTIETIQKNVYYNVEIPYNRLVHHARGHHANPSTDVKLQEDIRAGSFHARFGESVAKAWAGSIFTKK